MFQRRPDGTIDPRSLVGLLFVVGMVLAPFLAITFSLTIGLFVMVLALASSTWMAYDALKLTEPSLQPRVRLLATVTGVLTLICLGVLLTRVT